MSILARRVAGGSGLQRSWIAKRLAVNEAWIWVGVTLLFALMVMYPIARLVERAFLSQDGLTLASFAELLASQDTQEAARNSLLLAASATALSLLTGLPVTWLVTCTELPLRGTFRVAYLMAYVTPSFILATAYFILLARNGALNRWMVSVFGFSEPPLTVFGFPALVVITTLFCFPLMFLVVGAALQNIDPALEEAARLSGAGTLRTAATVTLPLVGPAIVSGTVLVFVTAITMFGTAIYIGAPAGISLVSLQIYRYMTHFPARLDLAAALSVVLLVFTVALIGISQLFGRHRSFASMGSSGRFQRAHDLGAWKWPGFFICAIVGIVGCVMPLLMILVAAFSTDWTTLPGPGNLTLRHMTDVFQSGRTWRAIFNSFLIAGLTGLVTVAMGSILAYVLARTRVRWRPLLELLIAVPLAVPAIALAVGLVLAYIRPPLVLYGTFWMFIVAYTTHFLVLPVRALVGTMRQIEPALEQASRVAGASWSRTFVSIVLPLVRTGLLAGFVLVVIPVLKEFVTAVLIFRQPWTTLSIELFDRYQSGKYEDVAALGLVFMVCVISAYAVLTRAAGPRAVARAE